MPNKYLNRVYCLLSTLIAFLFGGIYFSVFNVWLNYSKPQEINYQISTQARNEINQKIDQYLIECGSDYWLSWTVIDNDVYSFEQVKGYSKESKEVKDIKHLNSFYTEGHSLSSRDKNFLNKQETGFPGFYDEKNFEKLAKDSPALYLALNQTNSKIKLIGYAVTKSSQNNVVYFFALASNFSNLSRCNRHRIHDMLSELSVYAKRGL